MSLNLREDTRNYSIQSATGTLNGAGYSIAARHFAEGAPRLPIGMATTLAMGINGNPRAATSLLGSVAPELQSREMGGMYRMASMAAMFQVLPMFGRMISGIGGGVAGSFTNSLNVASMSSVPGSPLSLNFMAGIGANGANMSMRSIDPSSGAVAAFGVTAPAINSPAAAVMQRNSPIMVAGMNGPRGMDGPS